MKVLFHVAPKNYNYSIVEFKSNIVAIWLCHHQQYTYNNCKPVKTIWGFYDKKKKQFMAPVNSKTIGKVVDINKTTPYTAMPILK